MKEILVFVIVLLKSVAFQASLLQKLHHPALDVFFAGDVWTQSGMESALREWTVDMLERYSFINKQTAL